MVFPTDARASLLLRGLRPRDPLEDGGGALARLCWPESCLGFSWRTRPEVRLSPAGLANTIAKELSYTPGKGNRSAEHYNPPDRDARVPPQALPMNEPTNSARRAKAQAGVKAAASA